MVRLEVSGLETGESLFATHTGTCPGILLYHMPIYHLCELSVAHQKEIDVKKGKCEGTIEAIRFFRELQFLTDYRVSYF
jgi:hypothetical protein